MYLGSNFTARETFNISGTLPEHMIEDLLDSQEKLDIILEAVPAVEQAITYYPDEDFMETFGTVYTDNIFDELRYLQKRLRGENKETLEGIIEKLQDIQSGIVAQAQKGTAELRNALAEIEGA